MAPEAGARMSDNEADVLVAYGRQEGERAGFQRGVIMGSIAVFFAFVMFYEPIPPEPVEHVRYVLMPSGYTCP
jgi:hypothetical protein